MKSQNFNIIGLPGETMEEITETVRLKALIKPYVVWVSTFIPDPGSALSHLSKQMNIIDATKWQKVDSYRGESIFKGEALPCPAVKKLRITLFEALPTEQWENGAIKSLFASRHLAFDAYLCNKDISHYIKKTITIFF